MELFFLLPEKSPGGFGGQAPAVFEQLRRGEADPEGFCDGEGLPVLSHLGGGRDDVPTISVLHYSIRSFRFI